MNTSKSLMQRAMQGVVVATILIVLNFTLLSDPNEVRKPGILLPLALVPIAGAVGGIIVYYINPFDCTAGWRKTLRIVLSVLSYGFIILIAFGLGMKS